MLNITICMFIYAWLEYGVHRFDMHRKGSTRFKSHTIEHHGQAHMGTAQASLTPLDAFGVFIYTLPISLAICWIQDSPSFILTWAAFLFWAGFAWTAVHRNIHDQPGYQYAYLLCPWLPIVRWNHLKHHDNPKHYFGGMFWFLTGTW